MSDNNITISIIKHFCEKYNIPLQEKAYDDLCVLSDELLSYNEHTNLTAVRDLREVAIKHHADSLFLLTQPLPKNPRIIDVGCGAGFPGLPLKLAERSIDISFLDSTEKKLRFTELVSQKLLLDAKIYAARAEEAAKQSELRECFDVAVSRAMANLPVLCELCMPFVKKGGAFVAYKSASSADTSNPESELSKSLGGIKRLGGKVESVKYYDLCDFYDEATPDKQHCIIIIRKVSSTPNEYPRRYPQILKKPL